MRKRAGVWGNCAFCWAKAKNALEKIYSSVFFIHAEYALGTSLMIHGQPEELQDNHD